MNQVYPSAINRFLLGEIDITEVNLVAALVTDLYTFDPAHTWFGDLPPLSVPVPAVTVDVDYIDNGAVYVNPITFPAVPAGNHITAVIIGIGDVNGWLIAYIHKRADLVPIDIDTNDDDIVLTWPRLLKL